MIHIIGKDGLVHSNNPLNAKIALCGYAELTWPEGTSSKGRAWGGSKSSYNKKKNKLCSMFDYNKIYKGLIVYE